MAVNDQEAQDIESTLLGFMEEAYRLRFGTTASPIPGEGMPELLAKLLNVRRSMDRVEELLFKSLRIRARIERINTSVQADVDDKWDQAVKNTRSSSVLRGSDMVGPRERYADANLTTLEIRREARRVAALASTAGEAVDVIKLALRGLDSMRQDLNTAFRAMSFEANLER